MGAAVLSTYKLIRSLWPREAIIEQIYKASPLIGMIKKDTGFGEKIRYVTVGTSPPQGLGSFGQAKANKTASTAEEFQVQLASYFGNFSIGGDLYRRYKFTGNKAVLIRNVDGKQQTFSLRLNDLIKRGDLSANASMRPGDVLVIPESFF